MAKVDLTNPIFHDDDEAREHLESLLWPDGPVCPRCGVIGRPHYEAQGQVHSPRRLQVQGLPQAVLP